MYPLLFAALTLLVTCLAGVEMRAQYEWHHWVFGENVHVRFPVVGGQTQMAVADVPVPMLHLEGTTTWSDPTSGVLELYCDGKSVYNATGVKLPGRIGHANGISSTQSAQFVPHPKYSDSLFLFVSPDVSTTINTTNRTYSMVRLGRASSGQPWSIVGAPQYFDPEGSERLIASHSPSGREYWVYGFNPPRSVLTWRIDSNGFRGSTLTSTITDTASVYGAMKCTMDGRTMAFVSPDIIVLDINPTQGYVTQRGVIRAAEIAAACGEPAVREVYGLSFSPSGRYLYVTVEFEHEDTSSTPEYDLLQYDLAAPTWFAVITSVKRAAHVLNASFWPPALQLGPDSVIYMVSRNGLHAVRKPDTAAPFCDFQLGAVPYLPSLGKSGLTACLESTWFFKKKVQVAVAAEDVCEGADVVVEATLTGVYKDTVWTAPTLFTGERRTGKTLRVATPPPGRHTVLLELRGEFDTTLQTLDVVVYEKPDFSAPQVQTICAGDTVHISVVNAGVTQILNSSFSERTAAHAFAVYPPVTTVYAVEAINGACVDTVVYTVQVLQPRATVRHDTLLCGPDSIILPFVSASGNWLYDGNSYAAGDTVYVTGTTTLLHVDNANSCTVVDTFVIVIETQLTVDAGADLVICEGDAVTLTMSGQGLPHWEPAALCDAPDSYATRIHPTTSTTFVARISMGGCAAIDSIHVTVVDRIHTTVEVASASATPGDIIPMHIFITNPLNGLRCSIAMPSQLFRPIAVEHATLDSIVYGGNDGTGVAANSIVYFRLNSGALTDTVVIRAEALLAHIQQAALRCDVLETSECRSIEQIEGILAVDVCGGPMRSVTIQPLSTLTAIRIGDFIEVTGSIHDGDPIEVRLLSTIGEELGSLVWATSGTHTHRFFMPTHALVFVQVQGRAIHSVKGLMP